MKKIIEMLNPKSENKGLKANVSMCHDNGRENRTIIDFEGNHYDEAIYNKSTKKVAFTLAEAVIAIAVVGIVAVVVIATFIPKIYDHVRERQISAAKVKFTKAMEVMSLNEDLGPYYANTEDFVDNLQKYLKIAKVCDNDNLKECFGYDAITLTNGHKYKINDIKTGENMGMNKNDYGETIGLITLDGTSMLISWNKNCDIIPPNVYEWANDTNETTKCTAIIMDINGDKNPNKMNKDVVLFRAKKLSDCGLEFTVGGQTYCWGAPFSPTPITNEECEANKSDYGINTACCTSTYCNNNGDYWAGAMKQCHTDGKRLPTGRELAALATYLYGTTIPYNGETYTPTTSLTMNTTTLGNLSDALLSNYTSNGNWFDFWASSVCSQDCAWARTFNSTYTIHDGSRKSYSRSLAVCVP